MKFKKFDLENDCQGQRDKQELRQSTENIRFHVSDFQNFCYPAHIYIQKKWIHIRVCLRLMVEI